MVIIFHTPPTKSGKRAMFASLEDEMGLFDVVVFPKAQSRFAKLILTSEVLTVEGRLQRQGPGGLSVSMVMSRALTGLSGGLAKLLTNEMEIRILPRKKYYGSPTKSRLIHGRNEGESLEQLGSGYLRWFREAAKKGDINAQLITGMIYHEGQGVTQDYAGALKWFRKAAERGNADAQYAVGSMYEQVRA